MKAPASFVEPLGQHLESRGFRRIPELASAHWTGEIDGRSCDVRIATQGRTRYSGEVRRREHLGYRLRIELTTPLNARLFFVREDFAKNWLIRGIYRLRKQHVLNDMPAALKGFRAVTVDREYAQRLIQQPRAVTDIGDLLNLNASATLAGSIHFGPGAVFYASPILQEEALTPECVVEINEKLLSIITSAEALPPPQNRCVPTFLETFSKSQPILAVILILCGVLAAMLIVVGLLIAFAVILRSNFQ